MISSARSGIPDVMERSDIFRLILNGQIQKAFLWYNGQCRSVVLLDTRSGLMQNIKRHQISGKAYSDIRHVPGRLILPAAYLHKKAVPVSDREENGRI